MTLEDPDELCEECRKFDREINGGPASADIWITCKHPRDKQECFIEMNPNQLDISTKIMCGW